MEYEWSSCIAIIERYSYEFLRYRQSFRITVLHYEIWYVSFIHKRYRRAFDNCRSTVEQQTLADAVTATASDALKGGSGEWLRAAAVSQCEPAFRDLKLSFL